MFERKAAKIKLQVQGNDTKRVNGKRYRNIELYIKRNLEEQTVLIENINWKIDQLLQKWGD